MRTGKVTRDREGGQEGDNRCTPESDLYFAREEFAERGRERRVVEAQVELGVCVCVGCVCGGRKRHRE